MGALPPLKLPLIEFCKYDMKPGSTQWDSVQKEVVKALEDYGCFEARYDRISVELHDDVFKQLEVLFDLPAETKSRFVDPRKPYHGYLGKTTSYEVMGISGVLDSGGIQKLANLMWPKGNPKFCETLNSYAMTLSELESLITRMVFRSLGVEKYLDSHAKSLNHSIRVMRYEAPMTQEPRSRGSSHCDKNFLTILQQNHVNGLEVQTKDGKWIQVAPSASTFIVMVGESFLGWSNGRLHCPTHRVMMSGTKTRYSIGSFSTRRGVIKCPWELVDEQHPLLFKPFEEIDLLRLYQTEQGLKAESTLKAYCGV
ncbi:probable inactive 2-oxoglutarate-dependent dioxygenase AOP2 [Syzygium oleosum]|uniref:probable inactive 2-oxoglutarate-dependent dioxygenase AOP2 n=1 Tax=Syzygium oleosum TaxID=219896 RepID=UPI0011D2A2D7|nr:probable inactive 2-oxoglutarate-dependent dioxygenase AOP2 [Syzygium oleosum]